MDPVKRLTEMNTFNYHELAVYTCFLVLTVLISVCTFSDSLLRCHLSTVIGYITEYSVVLYSISAVVQFQRGNLSILCT